MSRIEIRPNRWVNLPLVLLTAGLVYVMAKVAFFGGFEGAVENPQPIGLDFKIAFGLGIAIGVFMFFVSLYRLIKAPLTFTLDSQGMYLNPAGVELGHFRWSDIAEIRVADVMGRKTSVGGERVLPAVAVVLKNPDAYIARFPKLMGPLFKFRQGETGTPLLLEPAMFGHRYEEIVTRMREEVAKANATR